MADITQAKKDGSAEGVVEALVDKAEKAIAIVPFAAVPIAVSFHDGVILAHCLTLAARRDRRERVSPAGRFPYIHDIHGVDGRRGPRRGRWAPGPGAYPLLSPTPTPKVAHRLGAVLLLTPTI